MRCADLPPALLPRVAQCRDVANAGGREAHTIALFCRDNYHRMPRLVWFLQVKALMRWHLGLHSRALKKRKTNK